MRFRALHSDSKTFASIGMGKLVLLRRLATGKTTQILRGTETAIGCLAFSPDGKTLAMGDGYLIRLWDVASGNQLMRLHGHDNAVLSLSFSPDGKTLASGGADQKIRLWNVAP